MAGKKREISALNVFEIIALLGFILTVGTPNIAGVFLVVCVVVFVYLIAFTFSFGYATLRKSKSPAFDGNLIAVAVIGLLLLIIFPHSYGHEKAREVSCASNMKQLGLGFIQYAQDYDGKWPGGADHWAGQVYVYEKSTGVYHCPDDPTAGTDTPTYPCSYAMNANLIGDPTTSLSAAHSTVLATEFDGVSPLNMTAAERSSPYTIGVMHNTAWGSVRLGTVATNKATRHDPRLIFLECDGHVKLCRPEKVSSGRDSPSPHGAQDSTHAAGTQAVDSMASPYTLTFSER